MCLRVVLPSGFSTDNVALVSADRAQISSLGSDSEVLAAHAEGAHLEGILTYGHTAISELITPGNVKITNLRQLDGKVIGIKGALPYEVSAMLAKAGVNLGSLQLVQVSYDPVIIDQGRIMGLPVYKSNEIRQLNELGYKYEVWDPTKYGVAASFASLVVNTDFAATTLVRWRTFSRRPRRVLVGLPPPGPGGRRLRSPRPPAARHHAPGRAVPLAGRVRHRRAQHAGRRADRRDRLPPRRGGVRAGPAAPPGPRRREHPPRFRREVHRRDLPRHAARSGRPGSAEGRLRSRGPAAERRQPAATLRFSSFSARCDGSSA